MSSLKSDMKEEKSEIIERCSRLESFKVPEGYFDNFAERFESEHLQKPRVIVSRKMHLFSYAAAVVLALVLTGVGFVVLQNHLEQKNMEYLSSDSYMETQLDELSEDELIEAILAQR